MMTGVVGLQGKGKVSGERLESRSREAYLVIGGKREGFRARSEREGERARESGRGWVRVVTHRARLRTARPSRDAAVGCWTT